MTEDEIDQHHPTSTKVDEFATRDENNEDDYIVAELRKTKEGRDYRYVESSGMDSIYVGAGNFGEWLTKEELPHWKVFEA